MSRSASIPAQFRASLFLLSIMLTACGGGGSGSGSSTPPPPPPIVSQPQITSFTASPSTIASGETVVLSWTSANTTDCSLVAEAGGTTSGSKTVGPLTENSAFVIECDGAQGTTPVTATVNVVVVPPPPAESYALTVSGPSQGYVVNDVLWEPNQQLLYVALGGTSSLNPNTVTAFDPRTGTLGASVFAGSEPRALEESDDGQYLYVGLGGADSIRRFLLPGLTPDIDIPSDPDELDGAPLFARWIKVAPGAPGTIAVGRINPQSSLSQEVISTFTPFMVFDGATARATASGAGADEPDYVLAWGSDSNTLYGASLVTDLSRGILDTYSTSATVTLSNSSQGSQPFGAFPGGMPTNGTMAYDDAGNVLDLTTGNIVGNYGNAHGIALPDPANNRLFYGDVDLSGNFTLQSYDLSSHLPLGSIARTLTGQETPIIRMTRWGIDGIAMTFYGGGLALISGPFIAPGGSSPPANSLPQQYNAGVKYVQIAPTILSVPANDIALDPTREVFYASIPSTAAANANSVAVINAATGAVNSYVPVLANPGPLAISDDGQYLYVANTTTIQRYLLSNFSLDLSIDLTSAGLGNCVPGSPTELKAAPANPHTVGLIIQNCLVFFTDKNSGGVVSPSNWFQWGADASIVYAIDSTATPITSLTLSLSGGAAKVVTSIEGRFSTVNLFPFNMEYTYANGLLYTGTGVISDPTTQRLTGTLPLTDDTNFNAIGGGFLAQEVGISTINPTSGRAFFAVSRNPLTVTGQINGISINSYNTSTYTPLVNAALSGLVGPAVELLQLSPTSFAVLSPNGQIALVSSPQFAL